MRIFLGRSWGGAIQGVQPIYQVGSDYRTGKRYGADGGLAHQVVARPVSVVREKNRLVLTLLGERHHEDPRSQARAWERTVFEALPRV